MDNPTRTTTSPPEAGPSTEPWTILARGAGSWTGRERMPPASRSPDGLESTAWLSARTVLGGRGLATDYVQEVEGGLTLTGHTLLWWDQAAGRFVMHFTSGAGGEPTVLNGRVDGERLVFEGVGSTGRMRQTFDFGGGRMRVTSEGLDPASGAWIVVFEGDYHQVDEGAAVPDAPESPADQGPAPGSVAWRDLTVDDAPRVRDFYRAVVGWSAREVPMGDYADYSMVAADETSVAGVCHSRGVNRDLPPVWLIYVVVEDIEASVRAAEAGGGTVVSPIRGMGGSRMAVIRDPAGAALALWEAEAPGSGPE